MCSKNIPGYIGMALVKVYLHRIKCNNNNNYKLHNILVQSRFTIFFNSKTNIHLTANKSFNCILILYKKEQKQVLFFNVKLQVIKSYTRLTNFNCTAKKQFPSQSFVSFSTQLSSILSLLMFYDG